MGLNELYAQRFVGEGLTFDDVLLVPAKSDVLPLEEVADEMLAILSDRDRIMQKHQTEYAQAKINEMYRNQE